MMHLVRQSFKRQLFVVFLSVTLLFVICGGILTVQGFQARIQANYAQNDLIQEEEVVSRLMGMLDQAEAAMVRIAGNEILMDALLRGKMENPWAIYSALYQETRDVRDFCTVDIYIGSNCVYTTSSFNANRNMPLAYSVFGEASQQMGRTIYSLDTGEATESGASLLVVRQLVQDEQPCFAVIRIERENIADLLAGALNYRDGFILTNQYFRPFCMMGTAESGEDLSLVRRNLMHGKLYGAGSANNIYISELGETGLLSIYITPPVIDDSVLIAEYQIVLMLCVISVVLCLIVSSWTSTWLSKPIAVLATAMKNFRNGDLDARVDMKRYDEFEQLAVGFNKTTVQIKEMMKNRVESERRLNEVRIAMMQAQLNPHFLYNTLDTIKWVAKANQVPEITTLSASLAKILRASISERQFCKLEQELKLVENYCEIQRIRFDDFFDLRIDVPGELMDSVIPKLILQPIVENAIIHGLEGRQDGHICINAEQSEEGVLTIAVTDNGCGISDEMISILRNDDPGALSGHLGLNNVGTIIRLYYGSEFGIDAERMPEGGTRMVLRLPLGREEPGMKSF